MQSPRFEHANFELDCPDCGKNIVSIDKNDPHEKWLTCECGHTRHKIAFMFHVKESAYTNS
jgi:hypothetical protein